MHDPSHSEQNNKQKDRWRINIKNGSTNNKPTNQQHILQLPAMPARNFSQANNNLGLKVQRLTIKNVTFHVKHSKIPSKKSVFLTYHNQDNVNWTKAGRAVVGDLMRQRTKDIVTDGCRMSNEKYKGGLYERSIILTGQYYPKTPHYWI